MKKVPSFKDIILLKAKEQEKKEMNKRIQVKLREEKSRQDMLKRKKAMKPKLVLSPITRCSKSTGDLRSLVCINEDEDVCDFNGCRSTINEDEEQILGETDAMECYHQKSRGRSNRSNGMKIRMKSEPKVNLSSLPHLYVFSCRLRAEIERATDSSEN